MDFGKPTNRVPKNEGGHWSWEKPSLRERIERERAEAAPKKIGELYPWRGVSIGDVEMQKRDLPKASLQRDARTQERQRLDICGMPFQNDENKEAKFEAVINAALKWLNERLALNRVIISGHVHTWNEEKKEWKRK